MTVRVSAFDGLRRVTLFGLGLTVTLTLYGAALAYVGRMAGFMAVQRPLFWVGGLLACVLGLWMMGILSFRLPQGGLPAWARRGPVWATPFLTGLALGNVGVGCPDPVFYTLMVYLAGVGDVAQGALMTAAYSAGRTLPIIGLGIVGLLGVNLAAPLVKRRVGVDRLFGWTLFGVGALIVSSLLFGAWFEVTWVHEGWNWGLHRLNENWGEIRGDAHTHVHEGAVVGLLAWIVATAMIPAVLLWWKGMARTRVLAVASGVAVLVAGFFLVPSAYDPELPHRLGADLRAAPVSAAPEPQARTSVDDAQPPAAEAAAAPPAVGDGHPHGRAHAHRHPSGQAHRASPSGAAPSPQVDAEPTEPPSSGSSR